MFQLTLLVISIGISIPSVVFAGAGDNVFSLSAYILEVIGYVDYLFWLTATAVFIWGLAKFVGNSEDSGAREQGRGFMIAAIIAFFVLASIWALVTFLLNSSEITPIPTPKYINKDGATL